MNEFLISFVITWALGLTPPLIIRYVFVRQPLSSKAATWVAAGFSVFFWIFFLYLKFEAGEEAGTGAVWFLVFFVARDIMLRENKQDPTAKQGKLDTVKALEDLGNKIDEPNERVEKLNKVKAD